VSERGEEREVLTHRCRAGLEEERGVVLPFFRGFEVDHCEYSPQVHIWWFGRMCNSSRTTGKLSTGPLIKPGRSEDFPIRKQRVCNFVDSHVDIRCRCSQTREIGFEAVHGQDSKAGTLAL